MRYSLALFVALWCCVFSALRLLPELTLTRTLVTLGSLLLAGIIADLLVKLAVDLLPRRLLPDLRNKAVLVTGCSSGFGLAVAKRLDALGVTVYAGLRNPQCPGAVELRETCTKNMHVLVLDVTKDEDVQHAVDYVRNTIGGKVLWAVINNAGMALASPVEWTPDSDYQVIWDTNTMGSVRVTKAFLPHLRESAGRLVFVNSMGGLCAVPVAVPYSVSKFALTGFAEGLRRELKRWKVSVHSVFPYFYKTKMTELQRNIDNVDKNWNNISTEVRKSYGNDYLTLFKMSVQKISLDISGEDTSWPVEDVIDAAVGATPQPFYVPDWKAKVFWWGMKHLPESFIDWCIKQEIKHP